jgi:nitroimidazol reductase NimA-like FMN-containing flavoprotein (pyridoxamine 5'-phosphate oxidase superfamily)
MANTQINPVPNKAACEQVLEDTREGTLVMCHENTPYAVPINHAFVDGKFYFHCALRGRKIDMIRQNPAVVYVVNKDHGSGGEPPEDGRCHGPWQSLIAYGTARVVEDNDEKAVIFRAFMDYYGKPGFQMSDLARNETSAIVIDVTSMTVRSEMVRGETDYWLWLPGE